MSPHLRNLLEDAANDGGRPVALDLMAVRTAGRRATWRQRALVGGGGIAAAAVITVVALVVAPGGPSPSGFATEPTSAPTFSDPGAEALADALAPLIDVLTDRGYEVEVEYSSGGGGAASDSGGDAGTATATGLVVTKDDTTGSAVVAEFTDLAALALVGKDSPRPEPCAAIPVLADEFVWDYCVTDADFDPDGDRYLSAKGGDGVDEALGVTLVRPDGTGISVSLSEGPHDPERIPSPAQSLDGLPLTAAELVEVLNLLDARAPLAPPMLPPPSAEPESPPSGFPCSGDAPPECLPMDGAFVEVGPLVDALLDRGLEVVTMSESVGESADSSASSTVLQFALSDGAGRIGSAAIGVYDDLESARQAGAGTTEPASWCAVPPVERPDFAWSVAGDGPACTGLDHSGIAQMLGFYHLEDAGDAVGATLVRADGSVISVSVGQAPAAEISSDATPLAVVPLNDADLLDLLAQLDAANREP